MTNRRKDDLMYKCPICYATLSTGLQPWHLACRGCYYEGSTLDRHILNQALGGDLDEVAREHALEPLRRANFRRLLASINHITQKTSIQGRLRLLDIGCAHGWFLEEARGDYDVFGIEPDRAIARAAASKGLRVREGFFPDALDTDERYNIIVFNDVLEHIPDVDAALQACRQHLAPGGLLVVNAPNRRGTLYLVSKWLLRLGRPGAFNRMWQKGFPSPHVHYFETKSILTLARRHSLTLLASERLPSVSINGLYSRVRYSKDVSPLKSFFLALAIAFAIPLLAALSPDIKVWFLTRENDSSASS